MGACDTAERRFLLPARDRSVAFSSSSSPLLLPVLLQGARASGSVPGGMRLLLAPVVEGPLLLRLALRASDASEAPLMQLLAGGC